MIRERNLFQKTFGIIYWIILALCCLTFLSIGIFAAEGDQLASCPEGNYILRSRDVLEIRLWGYPELTRTVTIQPDGMISLPVDGQIIAVGKSLEDLRLDIVAELRKALLSLESSQVRLTIISYCPVDISVLGEVRSPGLFPVSDRVNIIRALSLAGGLKETAGLKKANLIREDGSVIPIDLDKLLNKNDMTQNKMLYSGDSIYIPKAFELTNISVAGEVNAPGLYALEGNIDVLKALSAAQGLTEKAAIKKALINRQTGEIVQVDLEKLIQENDMAQNYRLSQGDSLFVPLMIENYVYVLGEVKAPGRYPIEGTCSVVEALSLAGGYNDIAKIKSCLVVREFPENEAGLEQRSITLDKVKVVRDEFEQVIEVNLKEILKDGDLAQNIPLQSQDILYIPAKPLAEVNLENTLDIIQTSISVYNVLK